MILCTSGRCCHPAFDCCSCCSRGRPQWLLIVQDFLDFYNSCSEGTVKRWRIAMSCQLVMGEATVAPSSRFHKFLDLLLFHSILVEWFKTCKSDEDKEHHVELIGNLTIKCLMQPLATFLGIPWHNVHLSIFIVLSPSSNHVMTPLLSTLVSRPRPF